MRPFLPVTFPLIMSKLTPIIDPKIEVSEFIQFGGIMVFFAAIVSVSRME
jgi:hypothetical protein